MSISKIMYAREKKKEILIEMFGNLTDDMQIICLWELICSDDCGSLHLAHGLYRNSAISSKLVKALKEYSC